MESSAGVQHGRDKDLNFFATMFYVQLKGQACDWSRLKGALEAMNDKRLIEYAAAVPDEWKTGNDATERILGYLKDARQNKAALFAAIDQILK